MRQVKNHFPEFGLPVCPLTFLIAASAHEGAKKKEICQEKDGIAVCNVCKAIQFLGRPYNRTCIFIFPGSGI